MQPSDEEQGKVRVRKIKPPPRFSGKGLIHDVVETLLLIAVIYTLVNLATARYIVDGSSMEPNFHNEEYIIVSRLDYMFGSPQRGDVIVFHSGDTSHPDLIKRVIGLPGESVKIGDGLVHINGEPLNETYIKTLPYSRGEWTLGPDEYFVMGDNRNNSRDSRAFGPLTRDQIVGRAFMVYWPPQHWGVVPSTEYVGTPSPTPTPTESPPIPTMPGQPDGITPQAPPYGLW